MSKKSTSRTKLEVVGDDYVIEQLKEWIKSMQWRLDYIHTSIIFVKHSSPTVTNK